MRLHGIGVSSGLTMGEAFIKLDYKEEVSQIEKVDKAKEIFRFEVAKKKAIQQLQTLYEETLNQIGEEEASIFKVHELLIDDEDYKESIISHINEQNLQAEKAVIQTRDSFVKIFNNMEDSYMRERADDIKDISNRLLALLENRKDISLASINKPCIVVAKSLLPSDTVQMNKKYVLGFVTEEGGENSHAAILARAMGIPSIIGAKGALEYIKTGQFIALDGDTGEIGIELEEKEIKEWEQKQVEYAKEIEQLNHLKGMPALTKDGVEIEINANITAPSDVESVIETGTSGVGLFRSEFLYMNKEKLPTEEEQFEAYKAVLEGLKGRVIIRTLDIGGDKEVPLLIKEKDDNPFLGYRAIRICLDQKDIFRVQLRALLRASVYGKLGIMFPMISTLEEIREAKFILKEVKEDLDKEKIPYSPNVEVGMMIETPSAVLLSDLFAKEVAFFSIGTNDLTQYMLATDRMNAKVAYLYDPHNLAVLRAIKMVVENAHKEGIWVGICGEAAADITLTETFLALGVDELSVSAGAILRLKEAVQKINTEDARIQLKL